MIFASAALAVVFLTACGTGASKSYTESELRSCFSQKDGLAVDPDPKSVDLIALKAKGGAILIDVNANEATVSIAANSAQADHIEQAYKNPIWSIGRLERHGNAVVAWNDDPAAAERDAVDSCF